MELRGIPIDAKTTKLILRSREALRDHLMDRVNRTASIFREGSFRRKSFLAWCRHTGIEWPRKISPTTGRAYRPLDDETMKDMESRHTFIGQVRQVLKTVRYLGRRSIKIDGRTRRHYFNTSPFRSVTGRNQPRKFIFSAEMDALAGHTRITRARPDLR